MFGRARRCEFHSRCATLQGRSISGLFALGEHLTPALSPARRGRRFLLTPGYYLAALQAAGVWKETRISRIEGYLLAGQMEKTTGDRNAVTPVVPQYVRETAPETIPGNRSIAGNTQSQDQGHDVSSSSIRASRVGNRGFRARINARGKTQRGEIHVRIGFRQPGNPCHLRRRERLHAPARHAFV